MDEPLSFQRARKPEEQQLRRAAILAAAAELFDAEGPQGAGLSAIAAKAGFTKSNVYRYFESREEVLLSLLLAAFEGLTAEIEAGARRVALGNIAALSQLAADGFAARPRLGQLLSILSTVIEQNVSEATILSLKHDMAAMLQRIAVAVHTRLPGTSLLDCLWAVGIVGALVAGMWPSAHPSAFVGEVMARSELAALKPIVERDLARAARALFASIVPSSLA